MAEASEQDRVRSYLAAQSAKLSAAEVAARVQEAADEFMAPLPAVPEEKRRVAPAPGEWSVAEIVDHVTLTLEEVDELIRQLSSGIVPSQPMTIGVEPLNAARPLDDLLDRLQRGQTRLMKLLAKPAIEKYAELRVSESLFGQVNAKGYALILRLHYRSHLEQIRKTLAAIG